MIWYAGRSETGLVRNHNEDNLFLNGSSREPDRDSFSCAGKSEEKGRTILAVCDGIGGGRCGEAASAAAVKFLGEEWASVAHDDLRQMILAVNASVCRELGIREGVEIGTTFTGLLLEGSRFSTWNVGDSRVYLLREERLRRLTKDHTQAQHMLDQGMISGPEADIIPARHVLTQYIGVPEEDFILSPQITGPAEIRPGDRLLLCSDGAYEMIGESCMRDLLMEKNNPEAAAEALMQAALTAGGNDNITVIVADIGEQDQM